jgi:hypothetical protein
LKSKHALSIAETNSSMLASSFSSIFLPLRRFFELFVVG